MAIYIKQSCFIKQTPERVFQVLTNFAEYSQWNPWLIDAEGVCEEGAVVKVAVKLGEKVGHYDHKVLKVVANQQLIWCDVGWFTVFADGKRSRFLSAKGEGTELEVVLEVTGFLSPLVSMLYHKALEEGMFNEILALKERAESCAG